MPADRKCYRNILSGGLLIGVEAHDVRLHVDLMNEVVVIAEDQRFPTPNGRFAWMKGAPHLHNGMGILRAFGRD